MKNIKHVNPKVFLHKVYTDEGGVKEHDKNQQAIGALKLAGAILILDGIKRIFDSIELLPIKALEKKDEDTNANTMSRM